MTFVNKEYKREYYHVHRDACIFQKIPNVNDSKKEKKIAIGIHMYNNNYHENGMCTT